jgi:hypothetical protein
MKIWKKLKQGKETPKGFLAYISQIESLIKTKSAIKSVEDALNLENLDKALAVRSAYKIKHTMELIA